MKGEHRHLKSNEKGYFYNRYERGDRVAQYMSFLAVNALAAVSQEAAEVISDGRISEQQAKELFEKVDADKSGVIEYEEFKQVHNVFS